MKCWMWLIWYLIKEKNIYEIITWRIFECWLLMWIRFVLNKQLCFRNTKQKTNSFPSKPFETFIVLIEKYGKSMENRSQMHINKIFRFNEIFLFFNVHVKWLDHWWNWIQFWKAFVHKMDFSRKYRNIPLEHGTKSKMKESLRSVTEWVSNINANILQFSDWFYNTCIGYWILGFNGNLNKFHWDSLFIFAWIEYCI